MRKALEMDYYKAGQEDSTYMDAFLKRYPESELAAQDHFDHALERMTARDSAGAAQEFQIVVVNFPGSSYAPRAQLKTAECYAGMQKWQQSADAYKKYLDYFPGGSERDLALFGLGVSYFQVEDYQNALVSFQSFVETFPSSQYADLARKNLVLAQKRLGNGMKQ